MMVVCILFDLCRLDGREDVCLFYHFKESFIMLQLAQYHIETGMGSLSTSSRDRLAKILSESELNEVESIGYTGKTTQGDRTSYQDYLNSLNKGSWNVCQIKFDNGDFFQTYNFAHAFDLDKLNS